MTSQIIIASIIAVFSWAVAILCIRNLFALRKEWREFDEMRKREVQLVRELDAFQTRVTEWAKQNPGTAVNAIGSQALLSEALHLQVRVREVCPDYDGEDATERLLSRIRPKGAA